MSLAEAMMRPFSHVPISGFRFAPPPGVLDSNRRARPPQFAKPLIYKKEKKIKSDIT